MGLAKHVQADRIPVMGSTFRQTNHDSGTYWTTSLRDMPISSLVASPGPLPSNTSPLSLTPLNSPRPFNTFDGCPFSTEASSETPLNTFFGKGPRCSMRSMVWAVLAKPKHRAIGWPLLVIYVIWTHQNLRKYPLEGFLGCVFSSGKQETVVTGEWNAVYQSCFSGECNITGGGGCADCTLHTM